MTDLYPMLIEPRYDERIWGGHNLAQKLGKAAPPDKLIGESWEVYEENRVMNGRYAGQTIGELRRPMGRALMGNVSPDEIFPLLTKLIDAQDVLSVQVHPDDRFAREHEHQPYGKTECWYIIDAVPGAELIYGFSRDSSPEEYERLVSEGKLEPILRFLPVKPGDVVYLPARTVHAIGAGIVLYELQQTSDITYRIYDWNRRDASGKPRELHVEKALEVLDYHRCTRGPIRPLRMPDGQRTVLIAGPYFCMELVEADLVVAIDTHQSPVAICALERPLMARTGNDHAAALARYSSLLVPAAAERYTLQPESSQGAGFRALAAYVPTSTEATRSDLIDRGASPREVDEFLSQFAPAS